MFIWINSKSIFKGCGIIIINNQPTVNNNNNNDKKDLIF